MNNSTNTTTLDFIKMLDKRLAELSNTVLSPPPCLEASPASKATAINEWRRALVWVRRIERCVGCCGDERGDGVLGAIDVRGTTLLLLPSIPQELRDMGERGFRHFLEPTDPQIHRTMLEDPRPFWKDAISAVRSASIIIRAKAKTVTEFGKQVLRACIEVEADQLETDWKDLMKSLVLGTELSNNTDQLAPVAQKDLLTKDEAARLLNRSTRSVDRLVAIGRLQKLKIEAGDRGHCLFRKGDVLRVLIGYQPLS
ncbi:MAG: helix-turn-helix domain-containing protein [Planctomycetes bacterium]|nr:helix-turn-helix domain-containing protein [Planctomycetota bacterium]MCW8134475.1 helix-turn-helix domain-containing protein [Planctomycetota bacterium]